MNKSIYIKGLSMLLGLLLFQIPLDDLRAQDSQNEVHIEALTKKLDSIYSDGRIVGFGVAIVGPEKPLYQAGFGYADQEEQKAYTTNTIQNIASISKTLIGVSLLKAQDMNLLDLDEPINKYLDFKVVNPHFPEDTIKIRQLTTHTSSIIDGDYYDKLSYILKEDENEGKKVYSYFRSPEKAESLADFLESQLSATGTGFKKKNFLKRKSGERFEYSNVGATLAAYVLEKASGQTFPSFVRQHILDPLNMSSSGWSFEEVDMNSYSKLYADPETELALYRLITYPDGGFITSVADQSKYLMDLMQGYSGAGKILSKEAYQELFTGQLDEDNFVERSENEYNDEYNMGVFMGLSAKGQIGHTGGDPGVVTFMFFNKFNKRGKILFVNTDIDDKGFQEFIEIWRTLIEYETQLKE